MYKRQVPKFIKEASVISDGQKCVGRSVENGSLIKRAKHGITIFSILVTWSLENAIETSDSMKCRGYGEKGRTAFSLYHFDKRDFLCLIFMIITFGAAIWGFSKGYAFCSYNPRIVVKGVPFTAGSLLVFAAFLLFSIMPAAMEILDRRMWKARRGQVESAAPAGYRLDVYKRQVL